MGRSCAALLALGAALIFAATGAAAEPERPRALQAATAASPTNLTLQSSVNGCPCFSTCDTSFDSLIPWCLTSESDVARDEVEDPCGRYSPRRAAYWDECTVNVTSQNHLATTFDQQWELMVLTCTATSMSAFFIVGVRALFSMCNIINRVWWLPLAFVAWGGILSAIFSSIASTMLAQIYLAIPFAIPQSFAISLGAAQAAVLLYWQLARGFNPAAM